MTLPAGPLSITALQPLPDHCAVLTLEDGTQVTVTRQNRPAMMPADDLEDVTLLLDWEKSAESAVYRVPHALRGSLTYTLGCQPHFPPALLAVTITSEAAEFEAWDNSPYLLTVPLPFSTRLDWVEPLPAGEPFGLTVYGEDRTRGFHFKVYPESEEGRAVLEALGWASALEGVPASTVFEAAD